MVKKPTSGFGLPTGSWKVDGAKAQVELYMPPKFHANRKTGLGGVNMGHLKYNASAVQFIFV